MAILEVATPVTSPRRPYLKDDRDPNQIQEDLKRKFYGDEVQNLASYGAPTYLIPEIVPFDPEWMDAATGLMVNVPSDPDFLSSFTFRRNHANLAIGTYAVDLSYIFPEGDRAMGFQHHGDAILRFSISRTQVRQELPHDRTAVIRHGRRFVQILDKHGENKRTWLPYRAFRQTDEGTQFETVWHPRSKKAYLDRMPETVGELYVAMSMLFESMYRLHGLDVYNEEFLWTATLSHVESDARRDDAWLSRLTGTDSYALWSSAIAYLKGLKDLSKLQRHGSSCRHATETTVKHLIEEALKLKSRSYSAAMSV